VVVDNDLSALTGSLGPSVRVIRVEGELEDALRRAGLSAADCFLAVADDDLANLRATLAAKGLAPDVPAVRTVARIFDDSVATRVGGALGIDVTVSTTRVAARAFVGAAPDERSFRSFDIEDVPYLAFRYEAPSDTATTVLDGWREGGARILAHQDAYGEVHPPSHLGDAIRAGERLTLAGPAESVRRLVLEDAPAEGATTPARTIP
jgi:Trk K+ transport system NAD-binding subunit